MYERPLLFIDVDGPLNPFRSTPESRSTAYRAYRMLPDSLALALGTALSAPLTVVLNAEHGEQIRALPFAPVWATTWEHEANEWIGPRIGLPELPVVEWQRPLRGDPSGLHWKTRTLADYARGRPFAWIDDETGAGDRSWLASRHPAPTLVLGVAPETGLLPAHFRALRAWAEGPAAEFAESVAESV